MIYMWKPNRISDADRPKLRSSIYIINHIDTSFFGVFMQDHLHIYQSADGRYQISQSFNDFEDLQNLDKTIAKLIYLYSYFSGFCSHRSSLTHHIIRHHQHIYNPKYILLTTHIFRTTTNHEEPKPNTPPMWNSLFYGFLEAATQVTQIRLDLTSLGCRSGISEPAGQQFAPGRDC